MNHPHAKKTSFPAPSASKGLRGRCKHRSKLNPMVSLRDVYRIHSAQVLITVVMAIWMTLLLPTATLRAEWFPAPQAPHIALTPEEASWLDTQEHIEIGIMDEWPPFAFIAPEGAPKGIDVDFIHAMNRRLNGKLSIVPGVWSDIYNRVKEKKLAALMDITPKESRTPYFNFTRPYIAVPHVIIAPKDMPFIGSESDLNGKTLALEEGFGNVAYFETHYPDVRIKPYPDTKAALESVARRETDAYAGNRAVAVYLMEERVMLNLKVHGPLKKEGSILSIGTRKDLPILRDILQKALDSISREERRSIIGKWTMVNNDIHPLLAPSLTPEEKRWLAAHPIIRVSSEPDYAPFDYQIKGEPVGYSVDYVRLLARRLNIRLAFVKDTWGNLLEKAKHREVDLLHTIFKTPAEREAYLNFTKPYKQTLDAIVTKKERVGIRTLSDIEHLHLALVKGDSAAGLLRQQMPGLNATMMDNYEAALKAVAYGQADATITELPVAIYLMKKLLLSNLTIAAELEDIEGRDTDYRLAVRKDWPQFISILEKAMATIQPEELSALDNRWFQRVQHSETKMPPTSTDSFISGAALQIAVIAILFFLIAWIVIRQIGRSHTDPLSSAFTTGSARRLILVLNTLLVAMTIALAWWAMDRVKSDIEKSTRQRLQSVIQSTATALRLRWIHRQLPAVESASFGAVDGDWDLLETRTPDDKQTYEAEKGNSGLHATFNQMIMERFPEKNERIYLFDRDALSKIQSKFQHQKDALIGVWHWDDTLDLGIAVELDAKEAFETYRTMKWVTFSILVLVVLFTLVFTIMILVIGQRANRALMASRDALEERVNERTKALKKLTRATEQSPVTVVITDKDGTIEYVNPTFTRVTGYSLEEAVGQNPRILKSDRHPPEFYRDLWETILAGETWTGDMVNLKKSGEAFWEQVAIAPLLDEHGEITNFVAVKEDITDKKRLLQELMEAKEGAEKANHAKSVFLANMSHEIRTPMNAILGYSQLMQHDTSLSREHLKHLEIINRSGDHLLKLINDILEMSKIEAGRIELTTAPFDLKEMIRELEWMFRQRADDNRLNFIIDSAPTLPRFIVADENKIRQILINLLGNAVKFTHTGEIRLTVNATSEVADTVCLVFEIMDTGPGVPEDHQELIFGAFEQSDAGRHSQGGTGLGLAISRKVARMMSGDITMRNREGTGAVFTFNCLVEKTEPLPTPSSTDASPRILHLREGTAPKKILVVDDRMYNVDLLSKMLLRVGFLVRQAYNGKEAVDLFETWRPHAVLMDVRMPVMDGIEATRKIRACERRLRHLESNGEPHPQAIIIAVSASSLEFQKKEILQKGLAEDFISKPFKEIEIYKTLAKYLDVEYTYIKGQSGNKTGFSTAFQKSNDAKQGRDTIEKETDLKEGKAIDIDRKASFGRLQEAFFSLPESLSKPLRQAVINLEVDQIREIATQIESMDKPLASKILSLLESFDFDTLGILSGVNER